MTRRTVSEEHCSSLPASGRPSWRAPSTTGSDSTYENPRRQKLPGVLAYSFLGDRTFPRHSLPDTALYGAGPESRSHAPIESESCPLTKYPPVILDYEDAAQSLVFLETNTDGLYLEKPAEIDRYRRCFDRLLAKALDPDDVPGYLRSLSA
ncbi:Scr1 family TA system antitoxin-like transcriptional regulator [Nocardiopsis composta]|uniref:Scr1 family TA system antitoxin-like transcriptional regulator n=1 Tax=Nocardiopsis composta TaxID=157465 RepID=UPI0028AAA50D|nr:Scr1 family TA system antitoxin-like transcriptional regulator [Nocardiopsis composta]